MTSKESFSDYVKRWRALASQMIDRPSEKDQIRTITRNLQPTLVPHLIASQASANFQSFFEAGLAVEEGLRDGLFPKLEGQKPKKTPYSGNQAALYGGTAGAGPSGTTNPTAEINEIGTQAPKPRREYTKFPTPLAHVFDALRQKGLLQPLDPVPLPRILSKNHNPNAYCNFHQQQGHFTNDCYRLRDHVQDLLDSGKNPSSASET